MGSVHGRPSAGGIPARFLRALALSLVLALVWSQGAVAAGADGGAGAGRQRLLVKLDRAATADQRLAVVQRNGGSAAGWVAQLGLLVVSLPEAQADGALRRYAGDPAVARVERDQARKAAAVPNDPSYPDQWALPAIGWDTVYAGPAPAGPATVAVLDTGVDTTVADLIGRTVAGWSALGGDPAADPNGHGTRLATIAAAAAGDGAGVAGVGYAPGVRVMPVQVLGSDGTGSDGDVIAGVTWAADHGADVILMGFSNPGFSQSLQDAVDYAWSKGAVLVAATGNGASTDPTYPAGDAKVVGVSATDSADAFWTGSNAGTDAFLAAPGVNVVADSPGGGTAPVTGTSASAAVVAGAAALLTAADPAATPGTVVGRLARTAAPVGTRAQTGNGRVDLARALADNASDEVVPAGAAPVGAGGPYVGPYTAGAQLSGTLQGQSNPACSSGGICPWQTTNLQGWGELQTIPMRLDFGPGQSGTSNSFTISLDHSNSGSQGLDGFTGWTPSANVTMSPAAPAPVKAINGAGAETWSYTFTAQANNASEGWILFNTKLLAGANSFSGSSLQVKGAGTIGFVKPAAAPGTPDLTVTKTGSTDVVNGQQVTYSLAYKNVASGSANNATGVLLKDELPAALTFVAGSCTGPVACSYDSVNRVLSWPVSTLAAGGPSAATTTVTYAATVGTGLSAGSTFSNNASIFGNQVDADTSSAGHQNISVVTSTVRQNKLVFTTGAPTISAGQTTGTITVQAQDFTGAALVGPRTVTLSSTSATGAFKDSAGTTTITSVSIPAGASTASFRYTDTTAGTPTITAASSGLASAQQAVTVNSSAQATLTVTSPDAGVYGDHLGMVASGGSGSGAVTFTVDAGSTACSILTTGPDAGKLAVTAGTGTCAITAHKAGDGTYSAADSASHPVTVGKASVTITPDAGQTKVFGSSEPLLTYTHSALVNGDTDAVFSGSLVRDAGENAGAYTIRLGTLSAGSNYALVLALTPVSFTVTPQHVTVTPNAGQSKVYGASDPTLAYTLSPTVPVTGALSRNAGENAGTYAITLGGLSAGTNYALDLVPTDFTITPRTVTVTPDAGQSKVYGSADPTLTFTNDAGLMPAAFTGALSRDPGSNVGNYPIRIGDLAAASSNYTVVLSGVTVNFAITAKHVTVTPAAGQSKVYGSSDPTLAYSLSPTVPVTGALSRNAGEDVGTYAITLGNLSAGSNYALDLVPADFTIVVKAVVVTPNSGQHKTYGDTDPALGYTLSEPVAVNSGALDRVSGENVGTYAIGLGTLASTDANHTLVLSGTVVNFTIVARVVTITPDTGQSKVFGSGDPALTFSNDAGLMPAAFTGGLSRVIGENVGTYGITLGTLGSASANYTLLLAATPVSFAITAKHVTVTPTAGLSKVYGGADPVLTFALSETVAHSGALARNAGENVGTYPIVLNDLAPTSTNYVFDLAPASFAITARSLTITPDAGQSKVYGSADPTLTYTHGVLVNGDGDSVFTGALSRDPGANVGTYAITLGNLSAGGNYTLTLVPASFAITPKHVTVTPAAGLSKVYGGADPVLTFALSETVAHSGALARNAGENVGTYPIVLNDLAPTSTNYVFDLAPASFAITARSLTITPDAGQSKVYGSADPTLTYTHGVLVNGDGDSVFGGALSRDPGANVGTYAITLGNLSAGANYTLTLVPASFAITPKHITVTPAAGLSKVYGSADPTLTFALSETVAHSGALARNAGENVGTYPIVLNDLAPTSTNYVFDLAPASFAITARSLTITPNAGQTKVFGSADPALTYTHGALVNGDTDAVFGGALNRASGEDVGPYAIGLGSLSAGSNYTLVLSSPTVNFVITPKHVTVTPTAGLSKVYGGADPVLTFALSESVAHSGALARNAGENVGTYPIVLNDLAPTSTNYVFDLAPASFAITARSLTITPDAGQSKVYGSADPTLTYTHGALVNGDGESVLGGALGRVAGENVNSYAFTLGTLSAGSNYTLVLASPAASFAITRKPVTITPNPGQTKVYGSNDPALTFTYTPLGWSDTSSVFTGALSRVAGENVGSYAITAGNLAAGGNYQLALASPSVDFTITRKTVTVTPSSGLTKVYGNADPTLTFTNTALGWSDTTSVFTGSLGRAPGENVGTYAINLGSLGAGGNYTVVLGSPVVSFSITARPVTLAAANQTKTYGNVFIFAGTEFTVTAGSLAPGDTATATLSSTGAPAGATVSGNPYPIVISGAQFTSGPATNYTVSYVNGTLTVTPRQAQVAYIGQTVFVTSGSSSTTAQVTLTASVADSTGSGGSVSNATVTFTDILSSPPKVLATGVKVSPVSGSDPLTGTANTVVTLSSGQYGAQAYLIEVKLSGSYTNSQQTGATPGSAPYEAAHPTVTVIIPPTAYSTQATATLTPTAAAGKYADASLVKYTAGMKYTNKGTNPQGQIQLQIERSDGTYYVKSNSVSSLAFGTGSPPKDVTIYTKASIFKIDANGVTTSVDGNVTLRMDAHEGCTSSPNCTNSTGDTIGFTVLSTKDSSLYYSNNWVYDSTTKAYKTVQQAVAPGSTAVVIN